MCLSCNAFSVIHFLKLNALCMADVQDVFLRGTHRDGFHLKCFQCLPQSFDNTSTLPVHLVQALFSGVRTAYYICFVVFADSPRGKVLYPRFPLSRPQLPSLQTTASHPLDHRLSLSDYRFPPFRPLLPTL